MAAVAQIVGSWRTGSWHVSVDGVDVTLFRGAPTSISNVTFTEPYGPQSASLRFPKVSGFEPFGRNNASLPWLRDGAKVSITWKPTGGRYGSMWPVLRTDSGIEASRGGSIFRGSTTGGDPGELRWDGRIVSISASNGDDGVSAECIGALHIFDNYLAQPFVALRPTPIEQAIVRALRLANERHPTGINAPVFVVDHPSAEVFDASRYARKVDLGTGAARRKLPYYLKPRGLTNGERWTGFTTRKLGGWDRTLTEYVDPLLKQLYTDRGQYTLRMYGGSGPILHHRVHDVGPQTLGLVIIDLMLPGVQCNFTQDFSMTLTTIYGKAATTLSSTEYDGQVYAPDGSYYWYQPFAKTPSVDPDSAPDPSVVRREVYDEFQYLQYDEAMEAARRHLSIAGDTGVVADLSITGVDPVMYARVDDGAEGVYSYPRQLITPGMRVRLDGLNGAVPGPVCMVTEATHSPDADSVSFRVDSKFRDYTTVRELRFRNRDALKPTHSLVVTPGFKLNITDPLIPWSYAKGCGFFPFASHKMWKRWLSSDTVQGMSFPNDWYAMTRAFPPKDPAYAKYYSKVPKGGPNGRGAFPDDLVNPRRFWNSRTDDQKNVNNEVLLSQAGEIDHTQIIAVDEDGEPVKAVFHISVWRDKVLASQAVKLPSGPEDYPLNVVKSWPHPDDPDNEKKNVIAFHTKKVDGDNRSAERWYLPSTPYPFFPSAWDSVDVQGRAISTMERATMYIGWGNHWEQAGYWPGSSRSQDSPTGVFEDTTDWQYNQANKGMYSSQDEYPDTKKGERPEEMQVAMAYVLIFCDSNIGKDVYFLGRFYKKEQMG